MLGGDHDFGADGKLLVCDASGTYLVDAGCVLGLVSSLLPLLSCLTTALLVWQQTAVLKGAQYLPCYCAHMAHASPAACLALLQPAGSHRKSGAGWLNPLPRTAGGR